MCSKAPVLKPTAMGPSRFAVALWIALWIGLSVSIILTNKYILGYTSFRFPFLLALWHMLLASLGARTMMSVLAVPDTIKQHGSRTLNMQLAAIGVLFGSALVLGNASFMFLSVPTIQMFKVNNNKDSATYEPALLSGKQMLHTALFLHGTQARHRASCSDRLHSSSSSCLMRWVQLLWRRLHREGMNSPAYFLQFLCLQHSCDNTAMMLWATGTAKQTSASTVCPLTSRGYTDVNTSVLTHICAPLRLSCRLADPLLSTCLALLWELSQHSF